MSKKITHAWMIKTLIAGIKLIGTSLLGAPLLATPLLASQESRPNILLFITDDESWLERSAYGWSDLPTPHFDRVAEQGILFTNGFCSAPSCAPARASILSGRNFWELEQGAFIQAFFPNKFPIFTHILEENGYQIAHTEKTWGPGARLSQGHGRVAGPAYNSMRYDELPDGIKNNDYAANFEQFLQERDPDAPFFFWAGVFEPHSPHGDENYKLLESEVGMTLDQLPLPPMLDDTIAQRQRRGNYLYEIVWADRHLGRMLESLEEHGLLENTLVVVTSDNGTGVSVGRRHFAKASPYDYGVHVPLAAMWPAKISSGRTVTDFVGFQDFGPTFLDVAGIEPPECMSGRSMLPLLVSSESGRIDPERDFIVTGLEWHGAFGDASRSVRDDRFSLIYRYVDETEDGEYLPNEEAIQPAKIEFYDLQEDPWQLNDLADDPAYSSERERLARIIRTYGLKTEDPRFTGEMDLFQKTREYVRTRRRLGYGQTLNMPFDE